MNEIQMSRQKSRILLTTNISPFVAVVIFRYQALGESSCVSSSCFKMRNLNGSSSLAFLLLFAPRRGVFKLVFVLFLRRGER